MNGVAVGLYVLAYLSAVIDGTLQDKGLYPSEPGRTGFRLYVQNHRWIIIGALAGIAATVIATTES